MDSSQSQIKLSDSEIKSIEELRCQVKACGPDDYFLSDVYLSRWLTAKHWDIPLAASAFIKNGEKLKTQSSSSKAYPPKKKNFLTILLAIGLVSATRAYLHAYPPAASGIAKDGFPVNFISMGKIDAAGITEKTTLDWRTQFFTYTFESIESKRKQAEDNVHGQYTKGSIIVLDATGLGFNHFNNATMAFMREASVIGKNNYPEAAGKMYIINAPTIFNFMWASLKPTINKDTLDKITVLGGDYLSSLSQFIALDQIPSNLGGNAPAMPTGGPYYNPGEQQGEDVEKWEQAIVPRSGVFDVPVEISVRSLIVWEFKTDDLDVGFGVFYTPPGSTDREENLPTKRYDSDKELIRDLIEAKQPGKYTLCWDNSYSWTKRKFLKYRFNDPEDGERYPGNGKQCPGRVRTIAC